jgi:hypothetical protein
VWNDLDWAAREIDSYLSQWDQLSQQDKNGLLNDINTYGQTLQEQSEKNLAQGRSLADPKVRANLERWSTFRSLEDRAQGEVNQDLLRAWRQVGWVFVGPYYLNLMRGAFKVPAGFPPGTTFRKYEPPPPITKTEQLY